jgi:glycosyltransferase involved in cell wall biosynthesis
VTHPRFLVGTSAHNMHVQSMVRALYEADALAAYVAGGVDVVHGRFGRYVRTAVSRLAPPLDRSLAKRAVLEVPSNLVEARWRWEAPRLVANRLGAIRFEDRLWERGEFDLDAYSARRLRAEDVTGYLGVEHGALTSLRTARECGKTAIVAFLSPHAATRARWVDVEWIRRPELRRRGQTAIDRLSAGRDARRQKEAETADWIVTNSSFTTRSLVEAGLPPSRILTVPLGGPPPIEAGLLPAMPGRRLRVVYAGAVSVHKGVHYLLRSWRRVADRGAELHLYGSVHLPTTLIDEARRSVNGGGIVVHGPVSAEELGRAYREASVVVLPSLCDGFGMVILEALASGVPVVTTTNAGGADAIEEGVSGFVIPPADEDALADVLTWCAEHPANLLAMRREALRRAGQWTWTAFRSRFGLTLGTALGWAAVVGDTRAAG